MMFSNHLFSIIGNYKVLSQMTPRKFPYVFYRTYVRTRKQSILLFPQKTNFTVHKCSYHGLLCQIKYRTNIVRPDISHKRNFHPIVWVVLRPVLKLAALFSGRAFRKWWQNLPQNKRQYFKSKLRQYSAEIAAGFSASVILIYYYYKSHEQETPITKRKRFVAFNPQQFKQIGAIEYKKLTYQFETSFLPNDHPSTKRVAKVVKQLLKANKDIPEIYDKAWTIAIVNNSTENAFVLPNGEIFVFGGMLQLCSNDDQLGAVLAHEMSHCILGHAAETFSIAHLLDCLMIVLITAIWAILPSDYLALFTHWLARQLVDILLQLPYNRKLETEADEVGLRLAAKACFDIRESSAFWAKMAILQHNLKEIPNIEFLSTHPSHERRSHHLDALMNEALKLRVDCGCGSLRSPDPRHYIEAHTKLLDEERRKYRAVIINIP